MELKPFIKKTVKPGEPLTAQAWNDILDAVDGAYQFLKASLHTVRVTITNPGLDPELVRVTASRVDAAPVEAVRPIPPGKEHVLSRLEPGAWTVTAEAPGFQTATATVTITDASPETSLSLALQQTGTFMPDLFGKPLAAARAELATAKLALVRLLDFNGRELPPQNPGSENDAAPVLVQSPPANVTLLVNAGVALVIAVPVQVEAAVEVPSLAGLTQLEAQKALEAIGLVVGKVTVLQK